MPTEKELCLIIRSKWQWLVYYTVRKQLFYNGNYYCPLFGRKMYNIEIEKDNFSKLMVAPWSSNTYLLSSFRTILDWIYHFEEWRLPFCKYRKYIFFSYYPRMTCHKRESSFKIGRNVLVCRYVHSYCRWAMWAASVKSKFCLARTETEQRDLGDL